MIITYRKENKEVVMLGQGVDNETLASASVAKNAKMTQGYKMYFEDGVIRYEKPIWMLDKEKKDEMDSDRIKLQNATSLEEIKPILEKLLSK